MTSREVFFRTLDDYRPLNDGGVALDFILEPAGRNTAPAIAAATTAAENRQQDRPHWQAQAIAQPQHANQQDEQADGKPRIILGEVGIRHMGRHRQGLAAHHLDHRRHAIADALAEIAGLELGRDHLVDDHPRLRIGQRAFQAVADFDAQFTVIPGDDQQRAVVFILFANGTGQHRSGTHAQHSG